MPTNPSAPQLAALEATLARDGLPGAIRMLNRRTIHRFTGIFCFRGDSLDNLFLFDRENPDAHSLPPRPIDHSYCSFIHATRQVFVLSDSSTDSRVQDHLKKDVIASYCGVPLHHPDGTLFGSLCHFDFRPIPFSALDLAFLESCAPVLMRMLVPPNPM